MPLRSEINAMDFPSRAHIGLRLRPSCPGITSMRNVGEVDGADLPQVNLRTSRSCLLARWWRTQPSCRSPVATVAATRRTTSSPSCSGMVTGAGAVVLAADRQQEASCDLLEFDLWQIRPPSTSPTLRHQRDPRQSVSLEPNVGPQQQVHQHFYVGSDGTPNILVYDFFDAQKQLPARRSSEPVGAISGV